MQVLLVKEWSAQMLVQYHLFMISMSILDSSMKQTKKHTCIVCVYCYIPVTRYTFLQYGVHESNCRNTNTLMPQLLSRHT